MAFLSTSYLKGKIHTKFYTPSGIEYIFLGIIIGPSFANWLKAAFHLNYLEIIDNSTLQQLSPGISAAIGIIGLIYGLKFRLADFQKSDTEHIRLVSFDIVTALFLIGGAAFGILYYFFYNGKNLNDIIAASYFLAVTGSVSSNYAINALLTKYRLDGPLSLAIDSVTKMNISLTIFIYGLLFGVYHIGGIDTLSADFGSHKITSTEWVVISILLALLVGILFNIFLGREENENKFFVAVVGITIFTSGLAYFLNFSPLYMNFLVGFVLVNFSKVSQKLEKALFRLLEPFGLLIVVTAGFYWVPAKLNIFIIGSIAFIVLRFISKKAASYFAFISAFEKEKLSAKIGSGLIAQDIIVCAMAIDYLNVYKNNLTPMVISYVLVSVIFFGLIGYSSTKKLLIDSGEIIGENQ
ncbi:hypothetical protein ABRY23_10850 [Melioribacteraceae bacterium 4301-Me]|uniref:hypothetical protein n=1 Tax=Pyranulibacter aquaticus TaxID=3163344 RepID=UPI00359965AE